MTSIHIPRLGGHIPALDGVRGVAVLLVIAYHVLLFGGGPGVRKVMTAGWVGVDLFFVLSGFLITGILLDARGKAHYFRNFIIRRSLRIFPLYYATLLAGFVALPLLVPRAAPPAPEVQAWFWTYVTNVYIAWHGWDAAWRYLDHFWSLAVEEQFYLFWPAVVFLCDRRRLLRVCLLCLALPPVFRVVAHLGWSERAAYVLLPARLDALVLGGLIALVARQPGGLQWLARWARPAAVVAGSVLLGIWYRRGGLDVYDRVVATLGYSVLAVFFGAVIVLAITADPRGRLGGLAASRPLRFFGRYSYAMYVFHHPVVLLLPAAGVTASLLPTLGGWRVPGFLLFGMVTLAVTMAVSLLSWNVLEQPFLRLKDRFAYSPEPAAPTPAPAPAAAPARDALTPLA